MIVDRGEPQTRPSTRSAPLPRLVTVRRIRHVRVGLPAAQILLAFTLLSGCAAPAADRREVHIGVLASLTGERVEVSGRATTEGADFAVAEANAAGGLLIGNARYKVIADYADVGDATDQATSAAQSLLTRTDIVAIVGPQYSRNALPVASLAENARVPMIAPMGTHPGITAGRHWVFRVNYTDAFQAVVMARWAAEGLHARRAAILYEESAPYSRSLADQFTSEFTRQQGTVVAREGYTRDRASDFSAALARIARTRPDIMVLPNELPDDTLQMTQARAAGITAPFLLGDFVDIGVMSGIPAARGLYTTQHWYPESPAPEARAFVQRFSAATGHAPKVTAASTYDAFRLLFDAMQRAGTTEATRLRDALSATAGFRGVTGPLRFAGKQDPDVPAVVLRFDGTRMQVMRVVAP